MTLRQEVERLIRVCEFQKEAYQREIEKLKDGNLNNDFKEYHIEFDNGVLTKLEDIIEYLQKILKEND